MNTEQLQKANAAAAQIEGLESASASVNRMRKGPDTGLNLDFMFARISDTARGHILALAQADIDAQLRDAKAAFEAL